MSLTTEQVAELDEATAPVDPDTSAGSDAEVSTDAPPPAPGEASESDPAPEIEEGVQPDKAKETAAQKAEREKAEQIASRWKLVEKAKAEHIRVAARERELTASTQRLEQERQQFALHQQQHASLVKEAQGILDKIASVRANPSIQGLRELGFDYMTLTTQMVEANTPEAIARAAAEETRQLREQIQQQQRQAHISAENRRDAQKLVAHVEENEELYPDLATYPPEKIAEDGIEIRDQHWREFKRPPTYQWVVEKMQEKAKAFEDARKARAAKRAGGTTSETTQASTNGNGPRATGPTGKPTLGNAAATTRATPPREMTEAEKDAWAIEQLRSLKQGAR
jgi:hypothetical protein